MTVYSPPGSPDSPVTVQARYDNFVGGEWLPPAKGERVEAKGERQENRGAANVARGENKEARGAGNVGRSIAQELVDGCRYNGRI